MMRTTGFILTSVITIGLIVALNTKFGIAPPFGKFLDPFNGVWQNAEEVTNSAPQDWKIAGLTDSVNVYLDERLVPHIFARNDADLLFMQGYITAKYRLWQMEIQTHAAAGRLTELVGEKALNADRLARRIGLEYGAENAVDFITKDTASKRLLEAYTKGVNAYIHQLKPRDYPLEYKLLDYQPEYWKPIKTALLLKNMANMLSATEFDIENTNFIAKYGMQAFQKLYPEHDGFDDYIIPKCTKWSFDSVKTTTAFIQENPKGSHSNSASNLGDDAYNDALPKTDDVLASNNWAVDGSKTKSGKPILCNDPHLLLNLPSIWFEMHLVSPTMNVYGATLPGAPCVISGFNDSISWGVTNAGRDVRDWFRIQFKDETHNEYFLDGKWEKTVKKLEHYKRKGKDDFVDTVLYTKFGPIVFDQSFTKAKSKNYLALKWTAHQPSNEFKTFYVMNQGKNYEDYLNALSFYTCPGQNFVFACRNGDIAMKEQGKFPLTKNIVADGTTTASDWQTIIPTEHNPTVKNPERGFVSSANQYPVDSTYPYKFTHIGVYELFRCTRINNLLRAAKNVDVSFMKKMQNDNYNTLASMLLPTILRVLDKSKLDAYSKQALKVLEQWNYYNEANVQAPVYFDEWSHEISRTLWDEMSDSTLPMKRPNYYHTANFLRLDSTSEFYDIRSTPMRETRKDIVTVAFNTIVHKLQKQYGSIEKIPDWGTHKATFIQHIAKLEALSRLHVYNGGNIGIINATNSDHGPSWRMIVDEGAMKGYCIYPGGQSGNAGSKFYDNMIDDWAKGNYYEAKFTKDRSALMQMGAKEVHIRQ